MKLTVFWMLVRIHANLKMIFGVDIVKNECDESGDGTLKLTISEEQTDGVN